MWQDIREIYARAGGFARGLPFLFLIPVAVEFAQHVVEIGIGMYDSRDAARAVAADGSRMAFGFAKVLALMLPGYWFVRYMAWNGDPRRAVAIENPALRLYLVQVVILGAVQAFALFGPAPSAMLGLGGQAATIAAVALAVLQSLIGVYLTAWFVAWPLGNATIGPVRSVGVMAGSFWRTLGYLIAGVLPLMALHYGFGIGAIGQPRGVVWVMMGLDALVVGFLALTIAGANFVAARHATQRKGIALHS